MNNLELLQVYNFDKKIRCGSHSDGGYVFAELDGGYDCYISAGISNEESFSRDFINKYNMNEYYYAHGNKIYTTDYELKVIDSFDDKYDLLLNRL